MSNKRKDIIFTIEAVINALTVLSGIFWIASLVAIVEAMKFSAKSLAVFIPCTIWLTIFGLYVHFVNK